VKAQGMGRHRCGRVLSGVGLTLGCWGFATSAQAADESAALRAGAAEPAAASVPAAPAAASVPAAPCARAGARAHGAFGAMAATPFGTGVAPWASRRLPYGAGFESRLEMAVTSPRGPDAPMRVFGGTRAQGHPWPPIPPSQALRGP
jgi:hypothetical protein